MNKPSERIVVFVTPAQKRAISATAGELGISVSELMRRAVIAFSATSDQVKAASIVDRLNAPRQPDALAQVLQRAARPLRTTRAGVIRPPAAAPGGVNGITPETGPAGHPDAATTADESAAALPADEPDVNHAAREIAQAVARLNAEAAAAAELDAAAAQTHTAEPLQPLSSAPFARSRRNADDPIDDAHSDDTTPEGGKFA
ncbi:hypothetical protein [Paraburkholderia unamae]|uniref:Ribbon-helix-helix CopG family protein n=1 Tax=Paraburkholderia unamae TaxID=219649 RepID=A0ABX5KLX5_9BURK|nr:hypothetical protein [Paraburkholderia unamae]PVX83150.1 hypothetical protein C7402_10756 [Paraburkholderia unamae]